jgi:hypothetical protein
VVLHGMCRCVSELSAWMQVNANNKVSSPRKNGTSHETMGLGLVFRVD